MDMVRHPMSTTVVPKYSDSQEHKGNDVRLTCGGVVSFSPFQCVRTHSWIDNATMVLYGRELSAKDVGAANDADGLRQ